MSSKRFVLTFFQLRGHVVGVVNEPNALQGHRRLGHRLRGGRQQADTPYPDNLSATMERTGEMSFFEESLY